MRINSLPPCNNGPITSCTVTSPIGNMTIYSCPRGLHSVGQDGVTEEKFSPDTSIPVKLIPTLRTTETLYEPTKQCITWLKQYFSDPLETQEIDLPPLCIQQSDKVPFKVKVWLALEANVNAGQTISYGGLAKLVESPMAARAVGSAMRSNPFQLVVPCHRVIRSDSSLGQYGGGCRNNVKKWLLTFEGAKDL